MLALSWDQCYFDPPIPYPLLFRRKARRHGRPEEKDLALPPRHAPQP
jgi:hypothetical protein